MSFGEKIKFMFSGIWDFLAPFVRIFVSSAGQILAASALQAVQTVATYAIDNDESKRAKAFALICGDLKSKGVGIGIEVTTSMINAAIEAAVQRMKEGK